MKKLSIIVCPTLSRSVVIEVGAGYSLILAKKDAGKRLVMINWAKRIIKENKLKPLNVHNGQIIG